MADQNSIISSREAGMMTIVGAQGVGKTYENMDVIVQYTKDKVETKIRGRKVLIFDTNGEYTPSQFEANGHSNFKPKLLSIRDVHDWCRSPLVECRRIDASPASIAEKKAALEYMLPKFTNGALVLDDINTYILNVTHMEEIVGRLVSLRHKASDVLISYQSLRAVEPRIMQNSRWFRMHYQVDDVEDIKDKVPDIPLFKIGQIIVHNRYFNGDERYHLIIHNFKRKIEGASMEEFRMACNKFFNINDRFVKQQMKAERQDELTAKNVLIDQYVKQYYYVQK